MTTNRTFCSATSRKHSARAYNSSITENPPLHLIRQRITTAAASFPYQPISVIYLFPPSPPQPVDDDDDDIIISIVIIILNIYIIIWLCAIYLHYTPPRVYYVDTLSRTHRYKLLLYYYILYYVAVYLVNALDAGLTNSPAAPIHPFHIVELYL